MRRSAEAFTALTRLLVVIAVALVGVFIPVGPAQSTALPVGAISAHAYDPLYASADLALVTSDRGSPAFAVQDATYVVFEHGSYSTSVPKGTATVLAVLAHGTNDGLSRSYDVGQAVASLSSDPAPARGTPSMSAVAPAGGSPSISRLGVATNGGIKALPSGAKITAQWGADTYRHGGLMSTIEHINYRHAYNSGFQGVSRCAQGTSARDIKGYVDYVLRNGTVTERGMIGDVGRTIGYDRAGNSVTGLEIIVRDGMIKTAYPVGVP